MGMLVYGVAESYGPVFAITSIIPSSYYYLSLSAGFIAGGFGALLAGYMTDYLGRRTSFLITAAMIVIGIAIYLAAPTNAAAIIISFILVGMAAIGAETPILAAISESVPAKYRGNLLVVVQNFGNICVALVFIPALLGLSSIQDEVAYALLLLAPLIALIVGYFSVKESVPWEAAEKTPESVKEAWQKIDQEAVEHVRPTMSVPMRWFLITLIGIVQDVAFVWITYDIGYLYFSEYSSVVPVIGGFAMAILGIVFGVFFVHKISRKNATLLAYGSQFILWILLWAYVATTGATAGLLLLALITIQFFGVELTWGVRAMLEPEVFPTISRGRWVSLARTFVWIIAGVITMVLSLYFYPSTSAQFMPFFNYSSAVVAVVFLVGLLAAIYWYYKGFETGGKSLAGHDIKS
ncbi:MAG: MFS transporter [Thaumarchaeota archaeon]|jgi:Na+/melibiose symporter-like transporter|nr:MFS transporter [Nitrososphaerota archaeon]